jgi:hypothetical protein
VALVGELAKRCEKRGRRRGIEIRERLIHHVDLGPHHEDPGHCEELALATRELGGFAPEQMPDPCSIGNAADPSADLFARQAQVLGPEGELTFDCGPDDLPRRVLQNSPDHDRAFA